jgi:hypothetical protein
MPNEYPQNDTPETRAYLEHLNPTLAREIHAVEQRWQFSLNLQERKQLEEKHSALVAQLHAHSTVKRTEVGTREPDPRPDEYQEDSKKNPFVGQRPHGPRVSPWPRQR